jgi:putative PIN family toxin of toxin-antitoxin system
VRAVLDPNVLVSSLVSAGGTPAAILRRWEGGAFELVVSDALLGELETALRYPRLRDRLSLEDGIAFVALIREKGLHATDPASPPRRSRDPKDDYLVALAEATGALLVSGDRDLLDLASELPIMPPREFLELLGS